MAIVQSSQSNVPAAGPGKVYSGVVEHGSAASNGTSAWGSRGRCVVLCEGEAPAALREGLARRGLTAVAVGDAAAAVLELARGVEATRLGGAVALVLVEPGRHEAVRELVAAARTYFPRIACWWYATGQGDSKPRLDVYDGHEQPDADEGRVEESEATMEDTDDGTARDGGTGLPLLSVEELEMLLGVDVPVGAGATGRAHAAAGLEAESEASL